jgi:hypothetical protein
MSVWAGFAILLTYLPQSHIAAMGATMEVRYVLPRDRTPIFATAKMANFIYWVLAHTALHYFYISQSPPPQLLKEARLL